ncbi:hypothetical protein, partial [Brucella intermedia]|uniref:hypothetical protein n=1 Tax=Brucella intermedia TaxID=94625 RepID=UPI00178C7790
LIVWGIIALAGYATYEGGGNPAEGLRVIGRGEDLVQALVAGGAAQALAFSSENFPEQTKAFLEAAAYVGALGDTAVTYIDEATGKVVSTTWNKIPTETQDLIKGGVIVASFVIPSGTATKIATKLPDMPKAPRTVSDLTSGLQPLPNTGGRVTQFQKVGGFDQANADFDALGLNNIRDITMPNGGTGRVGLLPDGTKVVVRSESSENRPGFISQPTLEIQYNDGPTKIRY